MTNLESILHFLDETFGVKEFPDYPHALNGLQVEGPGQVRSVAVAVDASEQTIMAASAWDAQLLLVHHGLFWDGLNPITGPRFRKVAALIRSGISLYALHLPLDAHPELGNAALLGQAVGVTREGSFGTFKGIEVGLWGRFSGGRGDLLGRAEEAVEGKVRLIPGGPERVERVGILTGGGAGALAEAGSKGLDTLITGEAAHHHYHEAMELGVNLLLAGHYATETFGVKALGERLAESFSLDWTFLDLPTGL
jgi:dinuclear metal center YbgI/SA1388 family protein